MKTFKAVRWMPALTASFIFLGGLSFGQTTGKSDDPAKAKAIQTKIDIGGYALFVNMAGEGSPSVIFEAGSPGTSSHWHLVQPEISKITKTFSYDRAGMGRSDKRNLPNSCLTQVQELHALLKKAEVKEPYIFVANSYGAFLAKLFTATYPREVAGVVFVDGTHEKYSDFLANNLTPAQLEMFKKMAASNPDGNFEDVVRGARQVQEAGNLDALRNKPVIVLSSDMEIMAKQLANTPMVAALSQWMNWQRDLAASSDKSRQYIIKGSGHMIHLEKPQAVINAIRKMIDYDLKDRLSPSYKTIALSPAQLKRFVGRYQFDENKILSIKEENGHLFADIPYLIQTEMFPISNNEIITPDMEIAATTIRLTESGIIITNKLTGEEKPAQRVEG